MSEAPALNPQQENGVIVSVGIADNSVLAGSAVHCQMESLTKKSFLPVKPTALDDCRRRILLRNGWQRVVADPLPSRVYVTG